MPYSPAIMDASFWPSVEEVVMCAADQVAKSFIVDTCIGYAIDRAPGPVWIELNLCQAVFEFWAVCPDCGTDQLMEFENIRWPEDVILGRTT